MAESKINVITVQDWGLVNEHVIKKFTLKNGANQEVDVITYGATITAIRTPDQFGKIGDVVLGFDDIDGYLSPDNPYFGATIGRVANRIANGRFSIDGVEYKVSKNIDDNSIHGGVRGWNYKVWNATIEKDSVLMTLLSEDGDEGYPGDVIASVAFRLSQGGKLQIEMKCSTTKPTPINLTNHSYFNLAGNGYFEDLYEHKIMINADRWTVTDANSIPTGEIRSVKETRMDLSSLTRLSSVSNDDPNGGYDYNFCLPEDDDKTNKNRFVAEVLHPRSGRYMKVYSNQPGVQFYTSNFLPVTDGILGKRGEKYFRHAALCLETQNYPDAINHANFPNSVLRPGQLYLHTVTYEFGVIKEETTAQTITK